MRKLSTFVRAARGVQWLLFAQLFTSAGQFFYAALTARAFPPSVFGSFTAALSLLGLVTLMTAGLPSFILSRTMVSKTLIQQIRVLAIVGGGLSALLFSAVCEPWLHLLRAQSGVVFIPLLAVALALSPIAVVESALIRRESLPHVDAICLLTAFLVSNGAGAIAIVTLGQQWTLGLATAIYPLVLFLLSRTFNSSSLTEPSRASTRDLLSFSRKITLQNLAFLVLQQLPGWVTSARAGAESLGHFARAATLTGMPATAFSMSINRALQPHWRKLEPNTPEVDKAVREAAVLASALSFPIFGMLLVHAPAIILLWLGPEWSESARFVPLLATAYGLSIPFAVLANSAEMRGLFRPVRLAQSAMAAGLAPGLLILYISEEPLWATAAMAFSQLCGIVVLVMKLPWHESSAMAKTLRGMLKQVGWAFLVCAPGWLTSQMIVKSNVTLLGTSAAVQLLAGIVTTAAVWLVVFRWNEVRLILVARGVRLPMTRSLKR